MHAHPVRRRIVMLLIAALLWQAPLSGGAQAAMVTTDRVLAMEQTERTGAEASARDRLLALLRREQVRAELAAHGVDAEEAAARVASLSDAEVAVLMGRIDSLAAGAGLCDEPRGILSCEGEIVFLVIWVLLLALGYFLLYWFVDWLLDESEDAPQRQATYSMKSKR